MKNTGKIVRDIGRELAIRNGEGCFFERKDGNILYIFTMYPEKHGYDDSPSCLYKVLSRDRGETWEASGVAVQACQEESGVQSATLFRMQNGDTGLVYNSRRGTYNEPHCYSTPYFRRSSDEGETFGEARPLTSPYTKSYSHVFHDKIIRLSSGRLVAPVPQLWTQNGSSKLKSAKNGLERRGIAVYFYSDDDAETWEASNPLTLPVSWTKTGLQEPACIELAPGFLYGWARTDAYCQYEMFSHDSGETWTAPQPSRWSSPCSPLSIKRHMETGMLLAVWNPVPELPNAPAPFTHDAFMGRCPLVYAVSRDNMKTWTKPVVLEDDPAWGYCYPAIHYTGDSVLLSYCRFNDHVETRIRKILFNELPEE
jgi:hypothetical protein